ncbi:hypothetical protein P9847_00525 [Paenibacillus chibensis]|uniref:Uncharacterized protein n=1 Tax=Paenibacillus chibensis TaxID=59846 RepID=A0ABU6PLQ6_9BACL|nr:hypothetical protein [Paenibacillus chibensis]
MYQRLSRIVLALLLGLTVVLAGGNMQADAKTAQTSQWSVKLVSVQLIENNHVGNEWYTEASVNQKPIEVGESITLQNPKSIKLEAYAEEQDKVPDIGTASKTIQISSLNQKTSTIELKVTVTENRGRYSGQKAYWKFVYQISKK